MSDWRDIESAPKEEIVDVWIPDRGRWTDASWTRNGWGREEWRGSHTVRVVPSQKPTHWMPLPNPPEDK